MNFKIIKIRDKKDLIDECATWFHSKWGVPKQAYLDSMEECVKNKTVVPQWYVALSGDKIIGGLGVIENDFHDRKDLTPNVCAVFVEENYRGNGVAGALLDFVVQDMKMLKTDTLYLLTDHDSFYERYGWELFCMVQGDGEEHMSRMYIHK